MPPLLEELHKVILRQKVFTDKEGNLEFPKFRSSEFYKNTPMKSSDYCSQIDLQIKGSGIATVVLPFFTVGQQLKWLKQGFRDLSLAELTCIIHPHEHLETAPNYVITILDVRDNDWTEGVLCQISGKLDSDACIILHPNVSVSLRFDDNVSTSLLMVIQVPDVDTENGLVYATIGARLGFRASRYEAQITGFYGRGNTHSQTSNVECREMIDIAGFLPAMERIHVSFTELEASSWISELLRRLKREPKHLPKKIADVSLMELSLDSSKLSEEGGQNPLHKPIILKISH